MIIIINNKFQFSIIKIDKAEEDISLYLDKKKELLDRCRPTIKKELKLESFLDELDESFDDVNNFSLHDTLKKCYNELFKTLDENEKLFKSESLVSILEDLNDNEEDIPFVLGAGYATSCRYWLYLRGLDGLKQYGSDEAYISLKVWREGGRCILLKDVVIGHIYRTAFPYKNDNAACVYNNLFIASLLFPESLRRRAFKIAESLNSSLYHDALKMLNSNASLIEELKAYYDSVFTRSFKDVVKLHQIVQPDDKEFADKYSNVLPKIAETIMDNINGNGIVKGKIGAAIWYYEYANYSSESKWTYIADNLLESVLADIVSVDLGSDFNEGLSGIGWGLMYMRERKLTKININEAIEFIHNKDNSLSSEDMLLSLNMVFEITPFIPRNPKRWDYSMNGVLGTSLHIMEIYRMLGNNTLF